MKASELRIGNWANDCFKDFQVTAQDLLIISDRQRGLVIKPIPLTEERLLRLGFISNPYQDSYEFKQIHVQCNKTRGKTELWIDGSPHIKYVHQLQNLYFALTGEELELKE